MNRAAVLLPHLRRAGQYSRFADQGEGRLGRIVDKFRLRLPLSGQYPGERTRVLSPNCWLLKRAIWPQGFSAATDSHGPKSDRFDGKSRQSEWPSLITPAMAPEAKLQVD